MGNNQDRIRELFEKLEILSKQQQGFLIQIQKIKEELNQLKKTSVAQPDTQITPPTPIPSIQPLEKSKEEQILPDHSREENKPIQPEKKPIVSRIQKPKKKSNIEKFIGENLVNKIGILIIIIGVAIGAKYSIENDLISPLTRIVLGYLTGLGLLGVGMKLKQKYKNFSAVLVSGAMAIMYFITFLAYDLYNIIPQTMTFILMLLFTAFTVFTAIHYNKQIIAHIGLVGAYAVPFLLSDGSGNVKILFSYMTIINIGILSIAIKKYWKPLYFVSFFLTWIIFLSWYVFEHNTEEHFILGFTFLSVFFILFYLIFLVYKLRKKESFRTTDVILQLCNSFVFYGIGISMLSNHDLGKELLGVFTLVNAIIHFIVSVIMYKMKLANRNLFYFASGMVLTFITIAFPVQLDGNWVTLLWAGEAALLFWIGRTKKVKIYEVLSYPLWFLTFFSLIHDWGELYYQYDPVQPETKLIPMFNIYLMTSVVCIISQLFIYNTHRRQKLLFPWPKQSWLYTMLTVVITLLLISTSYFTFWIEIDNYWDQILLYKKQLLSPQGYSDVKYEVISGVRNFKAIWLINYTVLFIILVSFVNIKKFKNKILGYITIIVMLIVLFSFLTRGLYVLSELRETYLALKETEFTVDPLLYVGIRYISYIFLGGLLATLYTYVRQKFLDRTFKIAFEIILHCALIWIVSSELIHWLDLAGYEGIYKLGLSILWGSYALLLIIIGIWKRKKYLRILAIIVFGITLLKLFFYDISHLGTISKAIVFLSLGVLLLIISFLYNKYKNIIGDEKEN
ncbi:DUF2339 domain-containing protein [Aquimarina longa]|uniref:DUF2339 domain-containing protein n=1 Tax=Aquimarina longa TaxID=1080221 RepID=UPI000781D86C|nr:DUF2339 domain-containing protein [Aquimarina longa]